MTIKEYFDNMGYFEKRSMITNALHNRDINSPFTKIQIIEFAQAEAKESVFNASYSALSGFDNDILFVGKPSIDPLTGQANTIADQSGLLDKANNAITGNFIKLAVGAAVLGFIYHKVTK